MLLDDRPGTDRLATAAAGILLTLTISATAQAQSQAAGPPAGGASSSSTADLQEVVVTGIRKSLESATNAKRDSVTFGDSILRKISASCRPPIWLRP